MLTLLGEKKFHQARKCIEANLSQCHSTLQTSFFPNSDPPPPPPLPPFALCPSNSRTKSYGKYVRHGNQERLAPVRLSRFLPISSLTDCFWSHDGSVRLLKAFPTLKSICGKILVVLGNILLRSGVSLCFAK